MKRIGRPPKPSHEKFRMLATSAPEATQVRVRDAAERLGLSISEFIRRAIENELDAADGGGSRSSVRGVRGPRLVERAVEGQGPQANSHELFWESLERVQARRNEMLAANKVVRGEGQSLCHKHYPAPAATSVA